MDDEHIRAKVFISCGQRAGPERVIADKIKTQLERLGYEGFLTMKGLDYPASGDVRAFREAHKATTKRAKRPHQSMKTKMHGRADLSEPKFEGSVEGTFPLSRHTSVT